LRSDQLSPGTRVELIVLMENSSDTTSDAGDDSWRRFAGAIKGSGPRGSDNDSIDRDIARGIEDELSGG
jgi:hypothetical protein